MALELDRRTILNPIIHLKHDPEILALELSEQLSKRIKRSPSQIKEAITHALDAQEAFIQDFYQRGKEILEKHDPDEPLVIVTGRPYNLYDERLNLRMGQNLAKIGVKAVPMDFVDVDTVDISDFPDMFWGLGAPILRNAKFIKAHANYFGLHITNFSSGADSFIEHFFKHVMGDKPYLILELDEHSAVAGVMTRLEAYRNVIDNTMQKMGLDRPVGKRVSN